MKRALALLALLLLSTQARAQTGCELQEKAQLLQSLADNVRPGAITPKIMRNLTCSLFDRLSTQQNQNGVLYARTYGVKADGVSSDDEALAKAVDACSALGATLVLPPGDILLTGVRTSELHSCALVGAGVVSGSPAGFKNGTTFLLTGASVVPFTVGSSWSMQGVNAFWPNQTTGHTVYPPFIQDAARTSITAFWYLDRVAFLNCYDCVSMQGGGGNWMVSNSNFYAINDAFRVSAIGDSVYMSNVHFTPGNWWNKTASAYLAATDYAATRNKVFHITATSAYPGGFNITMRNIGSFAWRYGFYVESGVSVGISDIDVLFDGVATHIDTSAGGVWNPGNKMRWAGACYVYVSSTGATIGNAPCFNMGATGELDLSQARFSNMRGSYVVTAGAGVALNDNDACGYGGALDGGDYYAVQVTGGNPRVSVRNSRFCGQRNTKTHGIGASAIALPVPIIENNHFTGVNDAINLLTPTNPGVIAGNTSDSTTGAQSLILAGLNPMLVANNLWDKPSVATVSACGTGATVAGGTGGVIFVGSPGPITSCVLDLPFVPYGGNGACVFTGGNYSAPYGGPSIFAGKLRWTISFAADLAGGQVFYNCAGRQ